MSEHISAILSDIKSLEPLPEIALRVLDLGSKADVVPGDLIAVLATDAGMTAKVLKLSNSALYGFRREIGSLNEAGNLLGTAALVNLVLTSCAGRYYRNYGAQDGARRRAMWEASVANALAASLVASVSGAVDKHRAYTAGLLADIGSVVLARFCASESSAIEAAIASGASAIDAERAVLGLDHAEVGARLCERWSFPESLANAVRWHHEPERARVDPMLAFTAHVASELTMRLRSPDSKAPSVEMSALERAGLDPLGLAELQALLARELERAREVVSA